jgi:hypothetical protein
VSEIVASGFAHGGLLHTASGDAGVS